MSENEENKDAVERRQHPLFRRPTALKYIRDRYGVEAHRGHRIIYTGRTHPVGGIILGGADGYLRVRLDGQKNTVRLHPTWEVEYLLSV